MMSARAFDANRTKIPMYEYSEGSYRSPINTLNFLHFLHSSKKKLHSEFHELTFQAEIHVSMYTGFQLY